MIIRILRAVLALVGVSDSGRCRCGHSHDAHEHYRPGSECSLCAQVIRVQGAALFPTHAVSPECDRYRPTWSRTL